MRRPSAPQIRRSVSAGTWHTCAVKTTGEAACWGLEHDSFVSAVPEKYAATKWSTVAAGLGISCGIKLDGQLICWGAVWSGRRATIPAQYRYSKWRAVAVRVDSYFYGEIDCACGILASHRLVCFRPDGGNDWVPCTAPLSHWSARDWVDVAISASHACGVSAGGDMRCWSVAHHYTGATSVPALANGSAAWVAVAVGNKFTCGILRSSSEATGVFRRLVCWGERASALTDGLGSEDSVQSVAAGRSHVCYILSTGGLVCRGENSDGHYYKPRAAS